MEVTGILHPSTCGFGRIINYELDILCLPLEERMEKYNAIFVKCQESFQVTSEILRRNFPKIVHTTRTIGKLRKEVKETILTEVSSKSWNELSSSL